VCVRFSGKEVGNPLVSGEAHGKPTALPTGKTPKRLDGLQMSNVQGEMRQFKFGLEPIIEFVPGVLAALEVEFKRAGAYLILR
jgi:hypothetical protein